MKAMMKPTTDPRLLKQRERAKTRLRDLFPRASHVGVRPAEERSTACALKYPMYAVVSFWASFFFYPHTLDCTCLVSGYGSGGAGGNSHGRGGNVVVRQWMV
jgi:hypothetical protein